jgi:hypothetical protein
MANKDATDKVLATIDLSKEKVALADHQFRIRRLEIQPGGEIAWHSHADRPALIYIISGKMTSTPATARCRSCTRPATSPGRPARPRTGGRTPAAKTAVLISADILHDQTDQNM